MTPERPRGADWDAWRGLVAALQSSAHNVACGTAIITVRLAVRDGQLVAWSDPKAERWNTDEAGWLGKQGLRPYKRDA